MSATTRRTFLSTIGTSAGALALAGLPAAARGATLPPGMIFTPSATFPIPSAPVLARLHDFVLALRVADTKLQLAQENFVDDDDGCSLNEANLAEIQASVRLCAAVFAGIITSPPTIAGYVFQAIAGYENQEARNTPHIEGAHLGLILAGKSLDAAMSLSARLDGEEVDAAYELMQAASFSITAAESLVQCCAISSYFNDAVLDNICAGRDVPSHEVLRERALEREFGKAA